MWKLGLCGRAIPFLGILLGPFQMFAKNSQKYSKFVAGVVFTSDNCSLVSMTPAMAENP
jgi:hypothetical protein